AAPGASESWVRPGGVPVQAQRPWTFAHDPRGMSGYAEGGELYEILEALPRTLVPFLRGENTYSRRVNTQVVQSLGGYDAETLALRGVLADAWQEDPGRLWLRVHINPRARFSDGAPVTAEDVRWTFHEFLMNPALETTQLRPVFDVIK